MKERPILFSAPMVRAILAGTKTQTRRAIKSAPVDDLGHVVSELHCGQYHPTIIRRGEEEPGPETFGAFTTDGEWAEPCPYGAPGERLWVREAWRVSNKYDATPPRDLPPRSMTVEYEAGGYACNGIAGEGWTVYPDAPRERPEWIGRLRPGMFMPRWASRIMLEVTAVRVERLQDISEADAAAEGIVRWYSEPDPPVFMLGAGDGAGVFGKPGAWRPKETAVLAYRALWESINGPGSWDANPWVWVVEFKRCPA